MIPGETVESVIEALKRIRAQGKTPVPHIAARNLESDKALRSVLIACATLDVHRVLLIGGGATQVTGPYAEVMDLLKTGLLADYGITHIDIAGHPAGNPDDPDPEQSLIAKLNWADAHGMHSRILTQWSFDAPGRELMDRTTARTGIQAACARRYTRAGNAKSVAALCDSLRCKNLVPSIKETGFESWPTPTNQ